MNSKPPAQLRLPPGFIIRDGAPVAIYATGRKLDKPRKARATGPKKRKNRPEKSVLRDYDFNSRLSAEFIDLKVFLTASKQLDELKRYYKARSRARAATMAIQVAFELAFEQGSQLKELSDKRRKEQDEIKADYALRAWREYFLSNP